MYVHYVCINVARYGRSVHLPMVFFLRCVLNIHKHSNIHTHSFRFCLHPVIHMDGCFQYDLLFSNSKLELIRLHLCC